MSTVKTNNVQVGQSGTATQNFTLYQPSVPDGTVRLAVGNAGATSLDVLTINNSGNINISATGARITGDFSGAVANRVMFQTSTANSATSVGAIPSGSSNFASFTAFNNSDPTNAAFFQIQAASTTEARLNSGITGTGTYLPMAFYTGGSERMRIDTSGNVGIGTSSPVAPLTFGNSKGIVWFNASGLFSSTTGAQIFKFSDNNLYIDNYDAGTSIIFRRSGFTETARIESSGNVLVTNPAGLGYGTGSGGTVTQATSKSTAVTLNKPTGQITMNNAALAAGASVQFGVNNTLVTANDIVIVTGSYQTIDPTNYRIESLWIGAGNFAIRVTNVTGGSRSEALQINFAIIKGATA